MILVAIVLAALILPLTATSHRPDGVMIIRARLHEIMLVKELWAEDHHATNGTVVLDKDLRPMVDNRFSFTNANRISGFSTYQINPIGIPPVARTQKELFHLPAGTLVRLTESNVLEGKLPNAREADPWQPLGTLGRAAR